MDSRHIFGEEYKLWINEISNRYIRSRIKAAVSVNRELVAFYWSIGRDIVDKQAENKWGSGFYKRLSSDLQTELPGVRGFAISNLRYVRRFYDLYKNTIRPQLVGETKEPYQDDGKYLISEDVLFSIPWGHHRLIIDKCSGNVNEAVFFVRKTIENNWSRAVLMNFLETGLFERKGKAITNFSYSLPEPQSDLAQEMTKDPYSFDFLAVQKDYNEKQLKDALVENVIKFLMELGKGFSFVGREYPLPIEGTEEFIDLLFYHLWLHCYVIVEVKVKAFSSADIEQTATYVAIADDLLRKANDNKSIGLIICKSKNNVLAKYAVDSSKEPIGISEYQLSNLLPSTQEIEQNLCDERSKDIPENN